MTDQELLSWASNANSAGTTQPTPGTGQPQQGNPTYTGGSMTDDQLLAWSNGVLNYGKPSSNSTSSNSLKNAIAAAKQAATKAGNEVYSFLQGTDEAAQNNWLNDLNRQNDEQQANIASLNARLDEIKEADSNTPFSEKIKALITGEKSEAAKARDEEKGNLQKALEQALEENKLTKSKLDTARQVYENRSIRNSVESAREGATSYAELEKYYSQSLNELNKARAAAVEDLNRIRHGGGYIGSNPEEQSAKQEADEKDALARLEKLERQIERVGGMQRYAMSRLTSDRGAEAVIRQGEELAQTAKEQGVEISNANRKAKDVADYLPNGAAGYTNFRNWVGLLSYLPEGGGKIASVAKAIGEAVRDLPEAYNPVSMIAELGIRAGEDAQHQPQDNWTQEQKDLYNYFYGSEDYGPEIAGKYAQRLNLAINTGEVNNQTEASYQSGLAAGDSAGSKAWKTIGGLAGAVPDMALAAGDFQNKLLDVLATGDYAGHRDATAHEQFSAFNRGRVEDLNRNTLSESIPVIGGKGWGDLYQLGQSSLQSLAMGNVLGEAATLGAFFVNAANSSFDEAMQRSGGNTEYASTVGLLSGAAEVLSEMLPLDHLLKGGKVGSLSFILKQAGIEGAGEAASSLMNQYFDRVAAKLTGEQTAIQQQISNLVRQGMSYEDAEKKVWKDAASDVAFDFVGGAVSGGISGGIQSVRNSLYDYAANRNSRNQQNTQTEQPTQPTQTEASQRPTTRNPLYEALNPQTPAAETATVAENATTAEPAPATPTTTQAVETPTSETNPSGVSATSAVNKPAASPENTERSAGYGKYDVRDKRADDIIRDVFRDLFARVRQTGEFTVNGKQIIVTPVTGSSNRFRYLVYQYGEQQKNVSGYSSPEDALLSAIKDSYYTEEIDQEAYERTGVPSWRGVIDLTSLTDSAEAPQAPTAETTTPTAEATTQPQAAEATEVAQETAAGPEPAATAEPENSFQATPEAIARAQNLPDDVRESLLAEFSAAQQDLQNNPELANDADFLQRLNDIFARANQAINEANAAAASAESAPTAEPAPAPAPAPETATASTGAEQSAETIPTSEQTTAERTNGMGNERERNMSRNLRGNENAEPELRDSFEQNRDLYTQLTNAEVAAKAAEIVGKGYDAAKNDIYEKIGQAKAGAKLAPEYAVAGYQLANEMVRRGEIEAARELCADIAAELTFAGQVGQIGRLILAADPSIRIRTVERLVKKLNDGLSNRQKAKNVKKGVGTESGEIKVSDEALQRYAEAETDEAANDAMDAIEQEIADQIPATFRDKFTALRYLNMLGNLKTQGRNIVGNAAMMTATNVKYLTQHVLELARAAATGGEYQGNTALNTSKELRQQAAADFEANIDEIKGDAKYADVGRQAAKGIQDKRQIFGTTGNALWDNTVGRGLEGARKATNWAMEVGDEIFLRQVYVRSFAGWMKAHGVTDVNSASPEQVSTAREFAKKEAQEATFHDSNKVSDWVSSLGRGQNTPKVIKMISEGIVPFRKTPANVAVRAIEYSPVGAIGTIYEAIQAKKGNASAADVINSAAKNLTGTALFGIGMLMAAAGRARASGDDEDKKLNEFKKLQGEMDYSVKVGDKYISLSQLAPMAIPFFMGVKLNELLEYSDNLFSADSIGDILGVVSEPMLEMSMLSGVNDFLNDLSSLNGDTDALPSLIGNAALSYLSQGLTNSLLGQLEQASERNRQTTYSDTKSADATGFDRFLGKNQYKIGKYSAKIPGIDYNQQDYVDAWGRTQSNGGVGERAFNAFLNPTYTGKDRSTDVDEELERLYRDNKGKDDFPDVFPQKRSRSDAIGDGVVMTPDEYLAFSQESGQKKLELVREFMQSSDYKNLTDEQRAETIHNLYAFADATALQKVRDANGVTVENKYAKISDLSDVPAYLAATERFKADAEKEGTTFNGWTNTNFEKYISSGLKDEDLDVLAENALSDARKPVYDLMREVGMSPKEYMDAITTMDGEKHDGQFKQADVYNWLTKNTTMSTEQKNQLWDMLGNNWKTSFSNYKPK